jgi:hypothetical protein
MSANQTYANNRARKAVGNTATQAGRAYAYVAPKVASAARYTAQKAANLGRGGLRMFRNFRSTANANTLRFLLRQTNAGTNLNNMMPYSTLRSIANRHLAAKTGRPLIFTDGATTVIRRVANTLANQNKVARQLAKQAANAAASAKAQAAMNQTKANVNRAQAAQAAARLANTAALAGNTGGAAVQYTNAAAAARASGKYPQVGVYPPGTVGTSI